MNESGVPTTTAQAAGARSSTAILNNPEEGVMSDITTEPKCPKCRGLSVIVPASVSPTFPAPECPKCRGRGTVRSTDV